MASETIANIPASSNTLSNTVNYLVMTDPQTQQAVNIPENLKDFIGHIASFNRKSGREQAEKKFDDLQIEHDSRVQELKELREKLKNGTEGNKQAEALKSEFDKVLTEKDKLIKKLQEESQTFKSKYEDKVITTDLLEAMSNSKLSFHNLQDSIAMLRFKGGAKTKEITDPTNGQDTGKSETVLTLSIPDETGIRRPQELTASDAVIKFFSQPENKFHINNSLNPGAGSTGSNFMGDNNLTSDQQYNEAMKRGDTKSAIAIKQKQFNESQTR